MVTVTFIPGEHPRPAWLRDRPGAWIAAVVTVCFGAFMGQLDASVVALTYPAIGHDFHAGLGAVQWITLSYLITLAGLLIPLGHLSDRLGRKRVYLWGFGLFTLASLGCAVAPDLGVLIVVRAVQGVGAAMLQANSVALVATASPRNQLRTALGIQAAAQAVGLALGPTLGGLVVQTVGWRWVFAINIPVGLVAIIAGRYLLPRTRLRAGTRRARIGSLLGQPGMIRGLAGAMLAYLLLFGPIVLVPTVLQRLGHSPLQAGAVVAALPVGFALAASFGDRLLPRAWPTTVRCAVGLGLAAVGLVALLAGGITPGPAAGALAIVGLGLGLYTPANNAAIMSGIAPEAAALAGGLVSASRALGTAGGTLLVSIVLTSATADWTVVALLVVAGVSGLTLLTRLPSRA